MIVIRTSTNNKTIKDTLLPAAETKRNNIVGIKSAVTKPPKILTSNTVRKRSFMSLIFTNRYREATVIPKAI